MIGDKQCDLDLGRAVGAAALLVRTGYGRETEAAGVAADRAFDDLAAALAWVLERLGAGVDLS